MLPDRFLGDAVGAMQVAVTAWAVASPEQRRRLPRGDGGVEELAALLDVVVLQTRGVAQPGLDCDERLAAGLEQVERGLTGEVPAVAGVLGVGQLMDGASEERAAVSGREADGESRDDGRAGRGMRMRNKGQRG